MKSGQQAGKMPSIGRGAAAKPAVKSAQAKQHERAVAAMAKVAGKKAPAPAKDTLREAYAATTIELENTRTALEALRETLVEVRGSRDAHVSRANEFNKERDELRKIAAALKTDNEDLRARFEFMERQAISLRVENEVARARGYIAGMKGEPFDRTVRQETHGAAQGGQLMAAIRHPMGDEEERHMTVERRLRPLGDFVS